ncbi:MAG: dCMP deaminase family protein [Candidatus Odinarchaeota archaeon]|nr:dCMP deaminase family protein [Candidatus Odinarchaeota archaeon]
MNHRPSKEEYYLEIAKAVSKRSTCLRRRFGAIIVVNDAIVSTGYNGPARGVINCYEVGCLKDELNVPEYGGYDVCPAVHAEENAIINAARNGASVNGGIMYIYGEYVKTGEPSESIPCDRCKRAIINAGIVQVITMNSKGQIVRYDVRDWVNYDTQRYVKMINEVRMKKSTKSIGKES